MSALRCRMAASGAAPPPRGDLRLLSRNRPVPDDRANAPDRISSIPWQVRKWRRRSTDRGTPLRKLR